MMMSRRRVQTASESLRERVNKGGEVERRIDLGC